MKIAASDLKPESVTVVVRIDPKNFLDHACLLLDSILKRPCCMVRLILSSVYMSLGRLSVGLFVALFAL